MRQRWDCWTAVLRQHDGKNRPWGGGRRFGGVSFSKFGAHPFAERPFPSSLSPACRGPFWSRNSFLFLALLCSPLRPRASSCLVNSGFNLDNSSESFCLKLSPLNKSRSVICSLEFPLLPLNMFFFCLRCSANILLPSSALPSRAAPSGGHLSLLLSLF